MQSLAWSISRCLSGSRRIWEDNLEIKCKCVRQVTFPVAIGTRVLILNMNKIGLQFRGFAIRYLNCLCKGVNCHYFYDWVNPICTGRLYEVFHVQGCSIIGQVYRPQYISQHSLYSKQFGIIQQLPAEVLRSQDVCGQENGSICASKDRHLKLISNYSRHRWWSTFLGRHWFYLWSRQITFWRRNSSPGWTYDISLKQKRNTTNIKQKTN